MEQLEHVPPDSISNIKILPSYSKSHSANSIITIELAVIPPNRSSSIQLSSPPPPAIARGGISGAVWTSGNRLFGETRTRILLLYALTMASIFLAAVPIFRMLVFAEIDRQERADLREELALFQRKYEAWDAQSPETEAALIEFIDGFLETERPPDENFHIVILDGQLYRANPSPLPEVIRPGSGMMERWQTLRAPVRDAVQFRDPTVGSILFKTYVLEINDDYHGVFVAVHISAEERAEAVGVVYVFITMVIAAMVLSLLLAWIGSRQLLKPVRQLAEATRNIGEADLSQRLSVEGTGELATLAANFNAMMDRVEQAFDSQRNFVNDAGHELRTPLTIIQGHLELMDDDPEEQAKTVALVIDELERMGRFVNDLVLLAKSERTDFLQLETIDVYPFIDEIFNKITAIGDRQWRLANQGQGTFIGDRQWITGALINLAQNATQHTQPTDTIELGAVRTAQQMRLWIRDTGVGISPGDQKRIFDRFARAANGKRRSGGAGLGLAIVKAIAEAHNGHVELDSQLGKGSTFTLVLPLDLA